jgi:hypothetical protein
MALRRYYKAFRPDPESWLFPSWKKDHHMSAGSKNAASAISPASPTTRALWGVFFNGEWVAVK